MNKFTDYLEISKRHLSDIERAKLYAQGKEVETSKQHTEKKLTAKELVAKKCGDWDEMFQTMAMRTIRRKKQVKHTVLPGTSRVVLLKDNLSKIYSAKADNFIHAQILIWINLYGEKNYTENEIFYDWSRGEPTDFICLSRMKDIKGNKYKIFLSESYSFYDGSTRYVKKFAEENREQIETLLKGQLFTIAKEIS